MCFKINQFEQGALAGLPHIQQLLYLLALRPYMDFATGVVGLKRKISHQSITEVLYVEPHRGYQWHSFKQMMPPPSCKMPSIY
nr:hypothetical protein 7 [Coxiellaceae bacterium]